ncbi:hypothetical protein HD554DRAFT_1587456 [Boletus coccyginus]|nr:hypothetical protein HD554DRAFT_1587456 [Boletus coccyginus]
MGALDNTFGAFLIGVVVSAILYGFTCIQTWLYYIRYPSDPWHIKLLVVGVFVSDTLHQALITHTVYTYLVTDFGVFAALGDIVWSLIVEVLFNGITALLVQSFLAMRVYRLSNESWLATGLVMILVIGEFVLVVVYAIQALPFKTFVQLTSLKTLSMSVNAVAAAGDVLIAVLLCALLQRSRTGFRRSDSLINKLIVFSINTGLLTSLCAIASLVSIVAWPNTFIYIAFYFCLGRLYCNSLLATLNARRSLRVDYGDEETSLTFQGLEQRTKQSMGGMILRRPRNVSIKVDTTQEYLQDKLSPSSRDAESPKVL